ncbi:hypothetical protein ACFVWR_06165 [Leifsonia sp. NPDC058292]|uniref:hypothetical protein n=1 Tax=Leifsonia sp. NPDC058292 TaxID=3346428 RepID=UPI0036DEE0FD
MSNQNPPFPAVLDLTSDDAYNVITAALAEYASRCDDDVEAADDHARLYNRPVDPLADRFRQKAAVARRRLDDIERQLSES